MKSQYVENHNELRKHHLLRKPVSLADIRLDDWYDDMSIRWQEKARRLQARRWRKIKHQLV